MIAQRFRPLGWVAGVATAATGLYLISLQVAAERGKLEAVERQIGSAQRQLVQLQTELGTRASYRQLEAWNGEVLDLKAPTAEQFVHGAAQLTALTMKLPDDKDTPQVALLADAMSAVPVAEAVLPTPVAQPRDAAPSDKTDKPKIAAQVKSKERAVVSGPVRTAAAKPVRPVKSASAKPASAKSSGPQRVAMLDARAMNDLSRVAASERRPRQ